MVESLYWTGVCAYRDMKDLLSQLCLMEAGALQR